MEDFSAQSGRSQRYEVETVVHDQDTARLASASLYPSQEVGRHEWGGRLVQSGRPLHEARAGKDCFSMPAQVLHVVAFDPALLSRRNTTAVMPQDRDGMVPVAEAACWLH